MKIMEILTIFSILATFIPACVALWFYYRSLQVSKKAIELERKSLELTEKSLEVERKSLELAGKSAEVERKSLEFDKNTIYEEHRPQVTLSSLTLDPDPNKAKIYKGITIHESGYDEYVKCPKKTKKFTTLYHKHKPYLLINICPKRIENTYDATLAFNVLNIKLTFSNNHFTRMRIIEAYSIKKDEEYDFGKGMTLDTELPINGTSLEIAVAYAHTKEEPSIAIDNIIKLQKSEKPEDKEKIDFLLQRNKATHCLNFDETAYLLMFETINDKTYLYTLMLKIENNILATSKVHNGRELFDNMLKKANDDIFGKNTTKTIALFDENEYDNEEQGYHFGESKIKQPTN